MNNNNPYNYELYSSEYKLKVFKDSIIGYNLYIYRDNKPTHLYGSIGTAYNVNIYLDEVLYIRFIGQPFSLGNPIITGSNLSYEEQLKIILLISSNWKLTSKYFANLVILYNELVNKYIFDTDNA